MRQNGFIKIAIVLALSLIALIAFFYTRSSLNQGQPVYRVLDLPTETAQPNQTSNFDLINAGITESRNNAIVNAIKRISHSVVNISAIQVKEVVNPWFRDFGNFFDFGLPRQERRYRSLGSGVIVSSDGYIITNEHVVEDADSIKVTLSDGSKFEATVVGEDFRSDIAVLKVESEDLPKATLGDSSDLLIGEWAVAIGNPFGVALRDPRPSATIGIISALDRSLKKEDRFYYNLIQTDTSINPGNSGGPLVNSLGQVIGINTAIYSTSGGSQGMGFAIPINPAQKIIKKLTKYRTIMLPKIGLEYQDLTDKIIEHLDLNITSGVLVAEVQEDSPAQEAGFSRMDIIQSIEDQPVDSDREVESIIRIFDVGDEIRFSIIRDNQGREISLTISELLRKYTVWGITVKEITPESASDYNDKGVIVTNVREDSFLKGKKGLKSGDLIYGINKYKTDSIESFRKLTRKVSRNRQVVIRFKRDGREYFLRTIVR